MHIEPISANDMMNGIFFNKKQDNIYHISKSYVMKYVNNMKINVFITHYQFFFYEETCGVL